MHRTISTRDAATNSKTIEFPSLQVFRGWAASLVLLFHASYLARTELKTPFLHDYFAFGSGGVDFFFVLSGFIICYLNYDDIGRPEKARLYLTKRLVRIYPIYWIITLILLPVYFAVPQFGRGDETHLSVIFGSLFLVPISRVPILNAGWTLVHEMFFYIVFAGLIVCRGKWMLALVFVWGTTVLAWAIIHFNVAYYPTNPWLKVLLWPQNLEFLLGCIAAVILRRVRRISVRLSAIVLTVCLIAALLIPFLPEEFLSFNRGKHVFVYGGLAFLIVISSTALERCGTDFVSILPTPFRRPMLYLGDASYSLYLVHAPSVALLLKLTFIFGLSAMLGGTTVTLLAIITALIAGCGCHEFIEKPLLKRLRPLLVAKAKGSRGSIPPPLPLSVDFVHEAHRPISE